MGELREFLEKSPIASRIALPTSVVERRLTLTPEALEGIADGGVFSPSDGGTCELEVGGQCVARGRIVRGKGRSYLKVTEIEEGGHR